MPKFACRKIAIFTIAGVVVAANLGFALLPWRDGDVWMSPTIVSTSVAELSALEPAAGDESDGITEEPPEDGVEMSTQSPEYVGDGDVPAETPGLGLPPIRISKMEKFEQLNDVVELLRERRQYLIRQEDQIVLRGQILEEREAQVQAALKRLEELRAEIDALIEKKSEDEERELERLVSVYEGMKAKKAAAIFNSLDTSVLIDVARRMRESKFALILQSMNPQRAKQITEKLAERVPLPDEVVPSGS